MMNPECTVPANEIYFYETPVVPHSNCKCKNGIFRDVIRLTTIKIKTGRANYILRYEGAYIVATAEMGG